MSFFALRVNYFIGLKNSSCIQTQKVFFLKKVDTGDIVNYVVARSRGGAVGSSLGS